MIHYLPICFILALLGTLLANPAFYYQLFKKRKNYKIALKEYEEKKAKDEESCARPVQKSDYSIFCSSKLPISLIMGQCVAFIAVFAFSAFVIYFALTSAVRFSTILAYLWIPAITHFFCLIIWADGCSSFDWDAEASIGRTTVILCIIFFVIPIVIGIHKGAYNYLYPYDNITIMVENYDDYPSVDEATLLEKANIADGSSIQEPIYRNGSWIYPIANDNSHVTSSGYLVVDSTGENVTFVAKDIVYSPWTISINLTSYVARRTLPSAVLFGNSTFQIEPQTGDVYFCKFYGDYACFRAGRKIEGAMLINATTGECTCYSLDELPSWVSGISF